MWERTSVRLFGGRHGLPPALVTQIQRERLLDALVQVVAELGYQGTSVEKVLNRAGVSRRTFYDLFADKEDCFLAAYDEVASHVLTLVVEGHAKGATPEERIQRALEAFLTFCTEEPQAARMFIVEVLAAGPRARERRADTMERLAGLMEESLRDLRGDRKLGSLAARSLVGGVHELIYLPVDRGEVADLPALAEQVVTTQVVPLAAV
jgi:AcrR family transcriptional regulator